jgi:hypothetical protein
MFPGNLTLRYPKVKPPTLPLHNTQLLSVSTAALTLNNFKACAGGFFRWGFAASAKKSPSEIFQVTQTSGTYWSSEHAL